MNSVNTDTAELELFRDMTRRALKQEVTPYFEAWEAAGIMPREIWYTLGQAGMLCVDLPEQYCAAGASFEVSQLVLGEMARMGYGGLASSFNIHSNIVAPYILHQGTEAQKQQWLPGMVSGDVVGAIAMTEPGTGSDLAALRTSAVRDGDEWVLNGSKIFITNGLQADLVIVCASTDPSAGSKGISLFLVDTSLPGFSRGKGISKIGQHSSDTAELFFDNLRLPADALLGEENRGFFYLMEELPRERLGCATQAIYATDGALELTLDYVQQRRAFGQAIGSFQNTRFKLAEVKTQLELCRAYYRQCMDKYIAATMTVEEAALLKLSSTEMQCQAADQCLQLFGGYGYTTEYPISRFYVDARVQTIYAGTSEIMKEMIARPMLGR
ncbi:acyl-CoA dehydrogenase family protein [Amphritea balenae]|uniref:Acyl-CoA dehydrogenase n=1 Tax=Amphritea balenae TaxID=452629 RepID=A0A3P1SP35_9GAMM|nr:acyl-CoA dehydrogenase family protein [Amphritea balenae]RRC98906.1 acyl-CoA dehydrogenase [Amphritea balenae]GGK62807.1 acyl-CoA dehydrogenase [Amphritea balenae]